MIDFSAGNGINTAKRFPFRNGMWNHSVRFWSINFGLFARHKQYSSTLMPGMCNLHWIVRVKQPRNGCWIYRSGPAAGVANSLGLWRKTMICRISSYPCSKGSCTKSNGKYFSPVTCTSLRSKDGMKHGKRSIPRNDRNVETEAVGPQGGQSHPIQCLVSPENRQMHLFFAYELSYIPM